MKRASTEYGGLGEGFGERVRKSKALVRKTRMIKQKKEQNEGRKKKVRGRSYSRREKKENRPRFLQEKKIEKRRKTLK